MSVSPIRLNVRIGGVRTRACTSFSKCERVTSVSPIRFSRNLGQAAMGASPSANALGSFSASPCSFSRYSSALPCAQGSHVRV